MEQEREKRKSYAHVAHGDLFPQRRFVIGPVYHSYHASNVLTCRRTFITTHSSFLPRRLEPQVRSTSFITDHFNSPGRAVRQVCLCVRAVTLK